MFERKRVRLGLLPILILVAAVSVGTRLGGIVLDGAGRAHAQSTVPTPGSNAPSRQKSAELATALVGERGERRPAALAQDPFDLTDEEIDILQSLSERREQLAQRERDIEQRAALLSAAEVRVERKIAELETLKRDIEGLLEQHDAESSGRIASLVKIYSSMKPKDAARIFSELDTPVLLQVIRAMPERISAAILAEMDPRQAKSITIELAEADALPLPRE